MYHTGLPSMLPEYQSFKKLFIYIRVLIVQWTVAYPRFEKGGYNIDGERGARAYIGGLGAKPPEADEISVIQILILP
jgi:hypothetical protein